MCLDLCDYKRQGKCTWNKVISVSVEKKNQKKSNLFYSQAIDSFAKEEK